jgi:3-oxoacyl-[acyl-carrier protein] reductase
MFDLSGKSALVTGASGGIGGAIAKALHARGATVGLSGTRVEPLEKLKAELGERAHVLPADLGDPVAIEALLKSADAVLGGIDILVNNAAWTDHKTLFDITEEEWDRTMNVCMRSVWYCTRATAKVMIEQKRKGRIVNIASTSGHWGRKEATAYTTAKAGVLNLTRSIAVQLAPEGIRVNSVSPNRIGSPVGQQDVPENRFVKNLAGRRGVPMDIAKAVVFMVSDESEFIYAIDLPVDGGALAIRD